MCCLLDVFGRKWCAVKAVGKYHRGVGETFSTEIRRPSADRRGAEGEGSGVQKRRCRGHDIWLHVSSLLQTWWYMLPVVRQKTRPMDRKTIATEMVRELPTEVLHVITNCLRSRFREAACQEIERSSRERSFCADLGEGEVVCLSIQEPLEKCTWEEKKVVRCEHIQVLLTNVLQKQ